MTNSPEIMNALGELTADNKEARRQRDKLFQKMEENQAATIEALHLARKSLEKVESLEPDVNKFRALRSYGIGALAGIAMVAGTAGAWAKDILYGVFKVH